MIIVQTGNGLDVVEEFVEGEKEVRIVGLRRHDTNEVIPLKDPRALMEVLQYELVRTGQ